MTGSKSNISPDVAAARRKAAILVAVCTVFGAAAVSMLELFIAFLQAYVFSFLAALFIGMAVHQH